MEQSRNKANDESVSLLNVGESEVDVSSRTLSTLSRNNYDSDAIGRRKLVESVFLWETVEKKRLGFPSVKGILLILLSFFSFQQVSFAFQLSIGPKPCIQTTAE